MSVIGKNTRENIGGKKTNKRNVKLFKEEYMEEIVNLIGELGKIGLTVLNENPPEDPEDREIARKCNTIVNAILGTNFRLADEYDD